MLSLKRNGAPFLWNGCAVLAEYAGATMPVIKPITDLRNTNEISELCHKQQQPVFITKNGYGDLVVMSMETYDELLSTNHIDKAKAGFSDPKSAIYNS